MSLTSLRLYSIFYSLRSSLAPNSPLRCFRHRRGPYLRPCHGLCIQAVVAIPLILIIDVVIIFIFITVVVFAILNGVKVK
jgi:hypothetical protein